MGVSLTERIAATNPQKPRTVTVKVFLDADLSDQREALQAELAAAKANPDERLSAPNPADAIQERIDALEEQESGSLIALKFTKLSGLRWAEISTAHPARPNVILDRQLGFNVPKVCTLVAEENGVIVEDDGTETPIEKSEWPALWEALSGFEVGSIIDRIWDLNVGIAAGRLERLGKA